MSTFWQKIDPGKPLKHSLHFLGWVIVLPLLGRVIRQAWYSLQTSSLQFAPIWLLSSVVMLMVAFLNGAFAWHLLLRAMRAQRSLLQDMAIWLIAQAAKYLPAGTVWYFGGRFVQGRQDGLDNATISTALALEFMFYFVNAFLLFGLSLGLWPDFARGWQASLATVVIITVWWFAWPYLFSLVRDYLCTQGGWKGNIAQALQRIHVGSIRLLALFYLFQWMLIGAAFWCLIAAVHTVVPQEVLIFGGIFSLSSALGYLAFFIPGGWGVREGILATLLNRFIPWGAVISVLARLWYTIVESMCALLGLIIHRAVTRKATRDLDNPTETAFTQKYY